MQAVQQLTVGEALQPEIRGRHVGVGAVAFEDQVGDEFSDAQGRSVVIVANTGKLSPEPGIGDCGPIPTSTTA